MNNRGQALVEFVLIVPVLILLILGMIEIGNIIYKKYELANDLDTIVNLYKEDKKDEIDNYSNKHSINIEYSTDTTYTTIIASKNIKITAPVVQNIIGSNYVINVERAIVNE